MSPSPLYSTESFAHALFPHDSINSKVALFLGLQSRSSASPTSSETTSRRASAIETTAPSTSKPSAASPVTPASESASASGSASRGASTPHTTHRSTSHEATSSFNLWCTYISQSVKLKLISAKTTLTRWRFRFWQKPSIIISTCKGGSQSTLLLVQRQQLVTSNVELVARLERCRHDAFLGFYREVNLVQRSKDLVHLSDGSLCLSLALSRSYDASSECPYLVFEVYRRIEVRYLRVNRGAHHLAFASMDESAHFCRSTSAQAQSTAILRSHLRRRPVAHKTVGSRLDLINFVNGCRYGGITV